MICTLWLFSVDPWNATGASIVGGTPAVEPVVATVVFVFSRKLYSAWVSEDWMRTVDWGRLSTFIKLSRWLVILIKENKLNLQLYTHKILNIKTLWKGLYPVALFTE